jgi:uncharacterized protein YndB with AHSA1/START domain
MYVDARIRRRTGIVREPPVEMSSRERIAMSNTAIAPVARVKQLIRRPVEEVFRAFVEPEILKRFWLSDASGPLVAGQRVRWDFMVPGASSETHVKELKQNRSIAIDWDDGTSVLWKFDARPDGSTVVEIENSGFRGEPHEAVATAIESTQGFTIVLCDLKTLLERGTSTNLARDKALLIEEELKK